jgi:hypothetical protein
MRLQHCCKFLRLIVVGIQPEFIGPSHSLFSQYSTSRRSQ